MVFFVFAGIGGTNPAARNPPYPPPVSLLCGAGKDLLYTVNYMRYPDITILDTIYLQINTDNINYTKCIFCIIEGMYLLYCISFRYVAEFFQHIGHFAFLKFLLLRFHSKLLNVRVSAMVF